MRRKDFAILIAGLIGGFAAGYAYCWWRTPLPQLVNDQGRSKVQNPARIVLQTGEAINRMKPLLQPIAAGRIPSPLDIYQIAQGVN
jgi:hypothetical protein